MSPPQLPLSDPLSPPPPGDPFFDSAFEAWELSRYADVMKALREPALWPVPPRKKKNLKIPDEMALQALRARILEEFSSSKLNQWQLRIDRLANEMASAHAMDLVTEFAEPLCLTIAEIVTGSSPDDHDFPSMELASYPAQPLSHRRNPAAPGNAGRWRLTRATSGTARFRWLDRPLSPYREPCRVY